MPEAETHARLWGFSALQHGQSAAARSGPHCTHPSPQKPAHASSGLTHATFPVAQSMRGQGSVGATRRLWLRAGALALACLAAVDRRTTTSSKAARCVRTNTVPLTASSPGAAAARGPEEPRRPPTVRQAGLRPHQGGVIISGQYGYTLCACGTGTRSTRVADVHAAPSEAACASRHIQRQMGLGSCPAKLSIYVHASANRSLHSQRGL